MSKRWNTEEEAFLLENLKKLSRAELADHFGVTVKSISDKLRRLNKKNNKSKKESTKTVVVDPLEKYGRIRKAFISDFIRLLDYRDLAKLAGIKPDDLKKSVEKTGIKLPLDRAKSWVDIDVGKYRSLSDCARCKVQHNHSSFLVGLKNCKKCIEKNIKLWLSSDIPIKLTFKGKN